MIYHVYHLVICLVAGVEGLRKISVVVICLFGSIGNQGWNGSFFLYLFIFENLVAVMVKTQCIHGLGSLGMTAGYKNVT